MQASFRTANRHGCSTVESQIPLRSIETLLVAKTIPSLKLRLLAARFMGAATEGSRRGLEAGLSQISTAACVDAALPQPPEG
jgi:hypothetical protein